MKLARDPAFGSVALLALTALVVLLQSPEIILFATASRDVPYSSKGHGSVAIELVGDTGRNGVYFVPKGTPLAGFLDEAGVRADASGCCPDPIAKATTVSVLREGKEVVSRPMSAAKRVALGIPIDVNVSSPEELTLVPGIGRVTAERLLERRSLAGPFRSLDDLAEIRGIKGKRLEKLRPYLCVGC